MLEEVLKVEGLEVLGVGAEEAKVAGRMSGMLERAGQTIGHIDPMIAAVAVVNGLVLVTGNVAHFGRLKELGFDLEVDNWREPLPLP